MQQEPITVGFSQLTEMILHLYRVNLFPLQVKVCTSLKGSVVSCPWGTVHERFGFISKQYAESDVVWESDNTSFSHANDSQSFRIIQGYGS